MNPGEIWLDALFIEGIDPTDARDISRAEILARKYIGTAVEHIKRLPGFELAFLSETSPMLGIRESRHIVGRYTLSSADEDVMHDDRIAVIRGDGRWFSQTMSVPYACLLPEFMDNIIFAGRCISATQDVYDAVRAIPSCMATGQAAGTAAALCAHSGDMSAASLDVPELQRRLRESGAVV
jgi:hypothetical protein